MISEVILMSGLDSIVAYHMLDKSPLPVYFRWGFETDEAEIAALPKETVVLDVPEYARMEYFKSRKVQDLAGRDTVMVNLVFQTYRPDVIYKGSLKAETTYVESSLEWCHAISELWSNVLQKECNVVMPFIQMFGEWEKRDVVEQAYILGIDLAKMQYCYNAAGNCGECTKCMLMRLCTIFTPEPDYEYVRQIMDQIEDGALENKEVSQMIGLKDAYEAFRQCMKTRY